MRKLKASFSLIIMILLVGMFSAVAFAAEGPGDLTVKQNADNTLTLNWGAVAGPKNHVYTDVTYDLTINEYGAGLADSATALAVTTHSTPALDAGKKYTLELTFNATDYKGNPVTGTTTIDYSMVDYNSTLTTGDDEDNNLNNANHTGANAGLNTGDISEYNGVNKALTGHTVHGSYQNNTNSCASCHQTHTGNSDMLLFKNGTYATCSSCHDGTLGFYNVFQESNAGTFGGSHAGNMSVHLSNGSVAIKAAPGGNTAGSGSWAGEFTCASCHAPHGSDSARLLATNPGGVASKEGNVVTTLPAFDANVPYVWLKTTVPADASNYPGLTTGDQVIQLYSIEGGAYKPFYDLTTKYKVSKGNWFTKADAKTIRAGVDFQYYTSTTKVGNPTNVFGYVPAGGNAANGYDVAAKGTFTLPIIVDAELVPATAANGVQYTVVDNRAYYDTTWTGYTAGAGKSMSAFCTACHSDYLSDTHSNESGVYTQTYRHKTNADDLTCVRCHFAHGTEAKVMKDSLDRGIPELTAPAGLYDGDAVAAEAYLLDTDPSSALKRYTGMAVCFACHDTSIANDEETWANTGAGKPGQQ